MDHGTRWRVVLAIVSAICLVGMLGLATLPAAATADGDASGPEAGPALDDLAAPGAGTATAPGGDVNETPPSEPTVRTTSAAVVNRSTTDHGPGERIENTSQFPHSAVVQLGVEVDSGEAVDRGATGFLVEPHIVATAAHTIYVKDEKDIRNEDLVVMPGRKNSDRFPFGKAEVTDVHLEPEYTEGDHPKVGFLSTHDFALLELDRPVGYEAGTFGVVNPQPMLEDADDSIQNVKVSGYPRDRPSTMWQDSGTITRPDADMEYHGERDHIFESEDHRTLNGQSGGPYFTGGVSSGNALGVLTWGGDGEPDGGTAFTEDRIDRIDEYAADEPARNPELVLPTDETWWFDPGTPIVRNATSGVTGASLTYYNNGPAAASDVEVQVALHRPASNPHEDPQTYEVCRDEDDQIDPYESNHVSCEGPIPDVPAGDYQVLVRIDPDRDIEMNRRAHTRMQIGTYSEPASSDIAVADVDPAVDGYSRGEPFAVSVDVKNHGQASGESDVEFGSDIGDCTLEDDTVHLDGNERQSLTAECVVEDDRGDAVVWATAGGSETSATVPPKVDLDVDAPDSVGAGDEFGIDVQVRNQMDDTYWGVLEGSVDVADCTPAEHSVGVFAGDSESYSFVCTAHPDSGDQTGEVVIETDDARETTTVAVGPGDGSDSDASFDVVDMDVTGLSNGIADPALEPGDRYEVTGTIRNSGSEAGTTSIGFDTAGPCENLEGQDPQAQRSLTLAPGDESTVSFTCDVPFGTEVPEEDYVAVQPTIAVEDSSGWARYELYEHVSALEPDADGDEQDVLRIVPAQSDSEFELSTVDAPDSVTVGERATINFVVHSDGSPGVQTVEMRSDGDVVAAKEVEVGRDDRQAGYFHYEPDADDVGEQTFTFTREDDEHTVTVYVLPESVEFPVVDVDYPDQITPGETVTADVTVANDGDADATTAVKLSVGTTSRDERELTLAGGQEATVELSSPLPREYDGDRVPLHVDTVTDDDSERVPVTDASADIVASEADAPSAVVPGGTVTVDVTLENRGEAAGSTAVDLLVGDDVEASDEITLSSGATETVSLRTAVSEDLAPGDEVELAVETEGGDATEVIDVDAPPRADLKVESIEVPTTAQTGSSITVEATVENVGEIGTTEDVDLSLDGWLSDTAVATVEDGTAETVQLTASVPDNLGDGDELDVEVSVGSDSESEVVAVEAREPEFVVTSLDAPSSGEPSTDVTVTATVENVGDAVGTTTANLVVAGEIHDTREITSETGTERSVRLSGSVPEGSSPGDEVQVSVETDDDVATEGIDVTERPNAVFEVTSLEAPDSAGPGSTITAEATVENVGNVGGTGDVSLVVDGVVEDSTSVSIQDGATTTATFDVDVPEDAEDSSAIELSVRVVGDAEGTTVDVESVPVGRVVDMRLEGLPHGLDDPHVRPGDEFDVDVTVENLRDASSETVVELQSSLPCDTAERTPYDDARTVELGPNETATVSLTCEVEYTSTVDGPVPVDVAVELRDSPDGTVQAQYELATFVEGLEADEFEYSGPNHELQIASVDGPSSVALDEDASFEVTIDNIGSPYETPGLRDEPAPDGPPFGVTLQTADGDIVAGDHFRVDRNGTVTLDVSYPESSRELGTRTLVVATDDDQVERTVNVTEPAPDIVLGGEYIPQSTDDTDRYWDVTGDDSVSLADVSVFQEYLFADSVQDHPEYFDFAGSDDGSVSHGDVVALFQHVVGV